MDAFPPGAGGTIVLPYLAGERDPRWDKRLTGEIHGLSLDSGPAEISRAVLESTAYGLAHIAKKLGEAGYGMHTLACGGSPALSQLWCEIKASVQDVTVLVPEKPDYSAAYGSALPVPDSTGGPNQVSDPQHGPCPPCKQSRPPVTPPTNASSNSATPP